MATLASSALTLSEWATRLDPGGKPAAVIELLGQTNEMLTDMLWMQCNDGAGHKTTIRTGLPNATWRLLNYGVQKSKSQTAQVREATGMLEAYSDIDKAIADLNGNTAEFRMGEDMAFIEAMNQGQQQTIVYGSTAANPERFTGLGPRFSAISGANNGVNIVDAGGTIQGQMKKIAQVTVRVKEARGVQVGINQGAVQEVKQRSNDMLGTAMAAYSGDWAVQVPSEWNRDGRLFVQQTYPLPVTVLDLIPEVNPGD